MVTPFSPISASIPPEVQMFFRDIKEHPDDDTPRLIFADWLQEYGDAAAAARGEFLRLQVLRHRLSPDDPNFGLLKRREGELFTEYRWTWLGPLVDAARTWTFERGMVQITAQAGDLLTPEVTIWTQTEAALWIDSLDLTAITYDSMNRLAYSPLLAHVVRLNLSGNPSRTALQVFFRAICAQPLPHLTQLLLCRNRLTTDQIEPLARCRDCRRLALLDLRRNQLGDTAAWMLAVSPYLKNLALLRLGRNRFSEEGIALLRRAFGERVRF